MVEISINDMFYEVICLNEGGEDFALCFSDPDGVRSGKSGWSFGVCQYDTQNNKNALICLHQCGFTDAEIKGIVEQTIDVKPLAAKLAENKEVIEHYDMLQLQHCLDSAGQFLENYNIAVADGAAFIMLADTINQYGSIGNGMAAGCRLFGKPVSAEEILRIKLTWKYSQTERGKNDTTRRYCNVVNVWDKYVDGDNMKEVANG